MAIVNHDTKEINFKVFYFGPQGSGKTENFRSLWSKTYPEAKSGLLNFIDSTQPSQLCDFLPVSIGYVRNYHLRLHLYTLPSPVLFSSIIDTILTGIDGFVFVADSSLENLMANIDCLASVKALIYSENFRYAELIKVFQYNKQDVKDALKPKILRNELNLRQYPDLTAVANQGIGTVETLQQIAKLLLEKISVSL